MVSNHTLVTPTQAKPARCPYRNVSTQGELPIRCASQAWVPGAAEQRDGMTAFMSFK